MSQLELNPVATNDLNFYVTPSGDAVSKIEYWFPSRSQRVVGMSSTGTTTTLLISQQGTGSPFAVGDAVTLSDWTLFLTVLILRDQHGRNCTDSSIDQFLMVLAGVITNTRIL